MIVANKLIDPKLDFNIPDRLEDFLVLMDKFYIKALSSIDMFDTNKTILWNMEQKQAFAKFFYHARGHFYKFLWCIGSRSKTKTMKDMVLENIKEEFGDEKKSHEQLYLDFAKALGVTLDNEIWEEKYYLPFLQRVR